MTSSVGYLMWPDNRKFDGYMIKEVGELSRNNIVTVYHKPLTTPIFMMYWIISSHSAGVRIVSRNDNMLIMEYHNNEIVIVIDSPRSRAIYSMNVIVSFIFLGFTMAALMS